VSGTIGNNISFSSSPLTAESAKQIILHLKNLAGTADWQKRTVTFSNQTLSALGETILDSSDSDLIETPMRWSSFLTDVIGWLY
jgi:hypothetical protein